MTRDIDARGIFTLRAMWKVASGFYYTDFSTDLSLRSLYAVQKLLMQNYKEGSTSWGGSAQQREIKKQNLCGKTQQNFGDLFQCSKEDEQRTCTYLLCHLSNIYNLSAWMMFTAYSINTWMKNMNSQSMNTQASTHKSISITWLSHYKTSFTEFIELNL